MTAMDLVGALKARLADRYEIGEPLGSGGMSTVYAAIELKHRRRVAIKVLRPELSQSIGMERFAREIELAAQLQHPNIVPLYESGEAAEQLYYVMPQVEGESLRQRLVRGGPLPAAEATHIADQVAQALAYAHARDVIHRDIKPENILLSGGAAVVTDFGIARVTGPDQATRLTNTGMVVGTPTYMSPEQAEGVALLDGRSDIYSLGCVYFEMLTGSPPFSGPTAQAVIAGHWSGRVPVVSHSRPEVPPAVDDVVGRSLAKRPDDRHRTAQEFSRALQAAMTGPVPGGARRVVARLARAARARKVVIVGTLAASALVAVGGMLAVYATRAGAPSRPPMLLVLPFTAASSSDPDFADGLTAEITARIAALRGLGVIAYTSAAQYDRAGKTPEIIARDFNVNYMLTGTIALDSTGGRRMVRVTTELARLPSGARVWGDAFRAELRPGELFRTQERIAQTVADTLHIAATLPMELAALASRPTENAEAYMLYLRGLAFSTRRYDASAMRQVESMFAGAAAADPRFAAAHAKLAQALVFDYRQFDRRPAVLERARAAVARAIAADSALPEARLARAALAFWLGGDDPVMRRDLEYVRAARPNDTELLWMAGTIERRDGKWEESIVTFQRALSLNPRSDLYCIELAGTEMMLHRHAEALVYIERAISLAPNYPAPRMQRAFVRLLEGDTAAARRDLAEAARQFGMPAMLTIILPRFRGMLRHGGAEYLDAVGALRLSDMPLDSGAFYLGKAEVAFLTGNRSARAYYDSARAVWNRRVLAQPGDAIAHMELAWSLAGLGLRDDAIREAGTSVGLWPVSRDAWSGSLRLNEAMRVALRVQADSVALMYARDLIARPSIVTPAVLHTDPEFAAVRDRPDFRAVFRRE